MAVLNDKAQKVFALKYSTRKTKGWREKCMEIANQMSEASRRYGKNEKEIEEIRDRYFNSLFELYFIPGGRIIANSGTGIKNLGNCFVLGIGDSRKSIYQTLGNAAEVFADGGGIGYFFGNIREEGAEIKTTGGSASGPMSFMTLYDQTGEVISQASRRGAQLASLDVRHPDIEKFIHFKSSLNHRNSRVVAEYDRNLKTSGRGQLKDTKYESVLIKTLQDDQLTHFNVSVLLSDDFMIAVRDNKDWDLVSPSSGKVVKTLKAKDLLKQMAEQAWESGDPGILLEDAMNRENLVDYLEKIRATNPCGEVPLLINESCILASLNLHKFYDKKTNDINWDELRSQVKTMTRFLEDVVEISEAPLPEINEKTKSLRRLGGGAMGWADLLVDLGIPYDSKEAVALADKISWFISFHSWETSYELAKERGAFSLYDETKANLSNPMRVLYASEYGKSNINPEDLKRVGFRNVAVNSIAPTGSIAILGGVNSSIEPFFALAYKRNITEGVGNIAKDFLFEINPALEEKLKEYGHSVEEINKIMEYAISHGTLTGCKMVSQEVQELFKTANEIPWKTHVDMQAAWQRWISNAISKTINIPESATPKDIFDIYFYMWEAGLKGGTIYRNNSKSFQILEKPREKKTNEK
jgi:ribonucleoside-diphosphate reductase alpha chain